MDRHATFPRISWFPLFSLHKYTIENRKTLYKSLQRFGFPLFLWSPNKTEEINGKNWLGIFCSNFLGEKRLINLWLRWDLNRRPPDVAIDQSNHLSYPVPWWWPSRIVRLKKLNRIVNCVLDFVWKWLQVYWHTDSLNHQTNVLLFNFL